MILTLFLFFLGIAMILKGADFLVDASSNIARRFKLSEFLIGVTIVGIGTSMPELAVSAFGALEGSSDIAIGNVTGSNICNILLILGVTALIAPMAVTKSNFRKDIPLGIAAAFWLMIMSINRSHQVITRVEGVILLVLFVLYLWYMFNEGSSESSEVEAPSGKLIKDILLVIVGLAGLIIGGKVFVNSATKIALAMGVSEAVIAVTLVALGTSMPELATSIIAAAKHRGQLALGNIIGSNIANILLIIGVSSCITPIHISNGISLYSVFIALGVSVLLFLPLLTNKRRMLGRVEGAIFLMIYIAYIYMSMVI